MRKLKQIFYSKSAQASLEFIILFIFALVLVSIALYFMGFFTLEFSKQEATIYREDIANLIIEEFNIYTKVHGGYERNVTIPSFVMRKYNITLDSSLSLMTIRDYVTESGDTLYYYDLPLDVDFSTFIDTDGNLIIFLSKNNTEDLTTVLVT